MTDEALWEGENELGGGRGAGAEVGGDELGGGRGQRGSKPELGRRCHLAARASCSDE